MDTLTLSSLAAALGFDACRITRADEPWAAGARLAEFVAEGRHGQMGWMETTLARRQAPTAMWPGARSAVVVGLNYGPDHNPLDALAHASKGNISVYARGRDYHDVLKKRLKQLARTFAAETGAEVKVFVDTAPLMEKPLAEKAGLGWQGKHTNLVSRELGNWLFLGVMLTSADLAPDAPETDHCGSCRACLDICPTDAFPAPYQLDARRCISYLTIEHKGPIPTAFRKAIRNRIYGCDDCLAICPWNKFAERSRQAQLHARAELVLPDLDSLVALDDTAFREVFSGSAVKRIGRDRFVRNVCVAIGNSGAPRLVTSLIPRLKDPSPAVRGAAIWALAQLDRARFEKERETHVGAEPAEDVVAEWETA
ncbi:MAG: tRNA epoxyqueuosine(34) reductase QueG [Pseudomonadota bacterium]